MKIGLIAITGMLSVAASGLTAAEIDSKVIHNYNYLGVGYEYLNDIADSDIDAHGVVGEFSFEKANFLFRAGGGYFWATDTGGADVDLWDVNASLGYVVRLVENHVNIIPRFTGAADGVDVEGSLFADYSWSILPGIELSYAINNQFAINGGYTYAYNFDTEEEDHRFNVGGKVALLEQVGLAVNAQFSKEFGFSGITGMVEFHY